MSGRTARPTQADLNRAVKAVASALPSKKTIPGWPRFLRREVAATYCGVSPGTFDKLVKEGTLPRPKMMSAVRGWDRADIDLMFDGLPYAGEEPDTSWDD